MTNQTVMSHRPCDGQNKLQIFWLGGKGCVFEQNFAWGCVLLDFAQTQNKNYTV